VDAEENERCELLVRKAEVKYVFHAEYEEKLGSDLSGSRLSCLQTTLRQKREDKDKDADADTEAHILPVPGVQIRWRAGVAEAKTEYIYSAKQMLSDIES